MPYASCPDCGMEVHYRGKPGQVLAPPCKILRENMGKSCIWPENAPGERLETVVANIHRDKELIHDAQMEGRYVYIGRPSGQHNQWGFGNPFSTKRDSKAARIVDDPLTAFRQWLLGEAHTDLMQDERRWILEQMPRLKGYVLGCFCVPYGPCHGDILKELIDTMKPDEIKPLLPDTTRKLEIRGLTLWQPWAWWIVRPDITDQQARQELEETGRIKLIENRSWAPPANLIGHYIAIHAGKTYETLHDRWYEERGIVDRPPAEADLVKGAIIGVCRLKSYTRNKEEVPETQRHWFFGPCGWQLSRPVLLPEPVPCRGFQGLWGLPDDVYRQVRAGYAKVLEAK